MVSPTPTNMGGLTACLINLSGSVDRNVRRCSLWFNKSSVIVLVSTALVLLYRAHARYPCERVYRKKVAFVWTQLEWLAFSSSVPWKSLGSVLQYGWVQASRNRHPGSCTIHLLGIVSWLGRIDWACPSLPLHLNGFRLMVLLAISTSSGACTLMIGPSWRNDPTLSWLQFRLHFGTGY